MHNSCDDQRVRPWLSWFQRPQFNRGRIATRARCVFLSVESQCFLDLFADYEEFKHTKGFFMKRINPWNPRTLLIADDVDIRSNWTLEPDMQVTLLIPWSNHWLLEAFAPSFLLSDFAVRVGGRNIYVPERLENPDAVESNLQQTLLSLLLEGRKLWKPSPERKHVPVCVRLLPLSLMCHVFSAVLQHTLRRSGRIILSQHHFGRQEPRSRCAHFRTWLLDRGANQYLEREGREDRREVAWGLARTAEISQNAIRFRSAQHDIPFHSEVHRCGHGSSECLQIDWDVQQLIGQERQLSN